MVSVVFWLSRTLFPLIFLTDFALPGAGLLSYGCIFPFHSARTCMARILLHFLNLLAGDLKSAYSVHVCFGSLHPYSSS